MRIGELSRTAGVPVATIKFYLREGLLPPGANTGPINQADYSERHLHRLHLIRTLLTVGGLTVAAARDTVRAIDNPAINHHDLLGKAHTALPARGHDHNSVDRPAADMTAAQSEVVEFLDRLGWPVPEPSDSMSMLADALVALRRLGRDVDADVFIPYAETADALAAQELATIDPTVPRESMVEDVVIGTVVFESVLIALRRLAHAKHSAARFKAP